MIHHLKTTILRIRLAMAESDLHWIETIGRQQRAEHRARLRRALGHSHRHRAPFEKGAARMTHDELTPLDGIFRLGRELAEHLEYLED